MKATVVVRLSDEMLDRLDALAERHGIDRSTVIRQFLEAGARANPPPTSAELDVVRRKRAPVRQRPGLVIPLAPLARAEDERSPLAA